MKEQVDHRKEGQGQPLKIMSKGMTGCELKLKKITLATVQRTGWGVGKGGETIAEQE